MTQQMTQLDTAHAAMQAHSGDDADSDTARLGFYERLADAELFVLLADEAQGDAIIPDLFEVAEGQFVLAFDLAERLAEFAGRSSQEAAPYASLSGRVLVQMLDGQGIGLGVNLDVAPSSILIPASAVSWLSQTLAAAPEELNSRVVAFDRPVGLPGALTGALISKLATAAGLASAAYLVRVTYEDDRQGHLLGIIGAVEAAQSALAKAVGEALTFSGLDAGELDVAFFAANDPVAHRLAEAGLSFDIPRPTAPPETRRAAPGSDPEKPPILK